MQNFQKPFKVLHFHQISFACILIIMKEVNWLIGMLSFRKIDAGVLLSQEKTVHLGSASKIPICVSIVEWMTSWQKLSGQANCQASGMRPTRNSGERS